MHINYLLHTIHIEKSRFGLVFILVLIDIVFIGSNVTTKVLNLQLYYMNNTIYKKKTAIFIFIQFNFLTLIAIKYA